MSHLALSDASLLLYAPNKPPFAASLATEASRAAGTSENHGKCGKIQDTTKKRMEKNKRFPSHGME